MVNLQLPYGFNGEIIHPNYGIDRKDFGLKLTPKKGVRSDSLFSEQNYKLTRRLLKQYGVLELDDDFVPSFFRYYDGVNEKHAATMDVRKEVAADICFHRDSTSPLAILLHCSRVPANVNIAPTLVGRETDIIPNYANCLESLATDLSKKLGFRFYKRESPGAWKHILDSKELADVYQAISSPYRHDYRLDQDEALANAFRYGVALLDNYFSLSNENRIKTLISLELLFDSMSLEKDIMQFYLGLTKALEGAVHRIEWKVRKTGIIDDGSVLHACYLKGIFSGEQIRHVELFFS